MSKKIYVLLSDTKTLPNRVIKFFTKDPYNHASISLDKNLNTLYSFGRKYVNFPFIATFVEENLHTGVFGKKINTTCALYSLEISDQKYKSISATIKKHKRNQKHLKYNYLGLISAAFNIPLKTKDRFFCSEFIASIFEESNIAIFNKPASLIRPYDFADSPLFKLEYEGKLKNYDPKIMYNNNAA